MSRSIFSTHKKKTEFFKRRSVFLTRYDIALGKEKTRNRVKERSETEGEV